MMAMATMLLIAVDFEETSRRAIDLAKQLAPPLGATLALLHVHHLPVYAYPDLDPATLPSFRREVTVAARAALQRLAEDTGIALTMLRDGDPAGEILAAAREHGAAMIVMGTHGRRGITHALLGSVAERVIRDSDVPVLTVRALPT